MHAEIVLICTGCIFSICCCFLKPFKEDHCSTTGNHEGAVMDTMTNISRKVSKEKKQQHKHDIKCSLMSE